MRVSSASSQEYYFQYPKLMSIMLSQGKWAECKGQLMKKIFKDKNLDYIKSLTIIKLTGYLLGTSQVLKFWQNDIVFKQPI
jgi:hypothetical protein